MSDYYFQVKSVPHSARAKAERLAVMRSLYPRADLVDDKGVISTFDKVQRFWRRRLNELRKGKWGPTESVRFQYMRNCPPAGVDAVPDVSTGYARPCRTVTICPWCWAREVTGRTFDAVVEAMTSLDGMYTRDGDGSYPVKAAVFASHARQPDYVEQPGMILDQVVGALARSSRASARARGWAVLGTVAPGKLGWTYSLRTLVIVPSDMTLPEGFKEVRPTKRGVAEAVAKFTRYPAGLMSGEADRVIRWLDARAGHRLLRFGGVLSKNFKGRQDSGEFGTRHLDL